MHIMPVRFRASTTDTAALAVNNTNRRTELAMRLIGHVQRRIKWNSFTYKSPALVVTRSKTELNWPVVLSAFGKLHSNASVLTLFDGIIENKSLKVWQLPDSTAAGPSLSDSVWSSFSSRPNMSLRSFRCHAICQLSPEHCPAQVNSYKVIRQTNRMSDGEKWIHSFNIGIRKPASFDSHRTWWESI